MKKFLNKKIILSIISVFLVISIVFLIYGNFSVDVQEIHVVTDKLPESFHNYLIAHISDYHNRNSEIVDNQIFDSLNEEQPDIIVITGDIIDSTHTKVDVALEFAKKLCEIAPVYYVTGNHECNISIDSQSSFDNMISDLEALGVEVLRGEKSEIKLENGEKINVFGIEDP